MEKIGSDAACTLFVSARRAVVKQIYTCKIEYYQHQMPQCDGDRQHTFIFLNYLMGHTLDPVMPTSSSDDELASRFSTFFQRRSLAFGVKLTRLLLIESCVDFPFVLLGISPSLISDGD